MKKMFVLMFVMAFLLVFPALSGATFITYSYDFYAIGEGSPDGSKSFLEATFNDYDSPGSVELKLEATGLTSSEYVDRLLFNFAPVTNLDSLSFNLVDGNTADISTGLDLFTADGEGLFDIEFTWGENAFGDGDEIVYMITSTDPELKDLLTAKNFDVWSTQDSTANIYKTLAYIEGGSGVAGSTDGFATTPEPSSIILLGLGLLGIGAYGFRRKRAQ